MNPKKIGEIEEYWPDGECYHPTIDWEEKNLFTGLLDSNGNPTMRQSPRLGFYLSGGE
jgi:hypothetical protein